MNKIAFVSLALITLLHIGCSSPKPENLTIVAPDAEIKKVASGFKFTEGPIADPRGNVYFTDIPNNRIHIVFLDGATATFMEDSGGVNGLYFDQDQNLLAAAGGSKKLISIDPDGKVTVLADKYNGKPFNSPNDLWLEPKGGIYFTDPRYGNRNNLPQDGEHVYYLTPDRKSVIRVIDDMTRPNGIIGTPDGRQLYVADHGDSKIFRYTIKKDGSLKNKTPFAPQGSDGMTMDIKGNVYITTDKVYVYDIAGLLIETIDIPERPSNVTFGGLNNDTLFITARTSIYSLKTNTRGL